KDPERVNNYFTYKFCYKMTRFYDNNSVCKRVANEMLSEYFDYLVQLLELFVNRNTSDSSITDSTINFSGSYVYCEFNVKYRCELCFADTCSHLENYGYYLTFVENKKTFFLLYD
ncbi:34093_t:CDS:1, partial [Gigaspora margarita]